MKGLHHKALFQHRGKPENHQNNLSARACTHTHTHTHTLVHIHTNCQPPTFTLEEEGHSGPVEEQRAGEERSDTLLGGCKHCKTVSPWKPAHCSEASHPHPSTLSKAKYPDRQAPNQPLACWLSSTADVQRGVALDGWILAALQKAREEER